MALTPIELKHITSFEKENGDLVTKRITQGKTRPFKTHSEAAVYARKKRSYMYELFCNITLPGDSKHKRKMYGYAVPN